MKKEEIKNLAKLLKEANQEAQSFKHIEDGGTCNLDSLVINLKGVRKNMIELLESESGFKTSKIHSKWWVGYYFVFLNFSGQGNRNTMMVEKAKKYLAEKGVNCAVYYQMD